MYSAVGTADRQAILRAAYALASNLTEVQEALAELAGLECEEGPEEEEEKCEVERPVPALQAVRIEASLIFLVCLPFTCLCGVFVIAGQGHPQRLRASHV